MTWYKDWFGQDYIKVYPHRDTAEAQYQVDFVERILSLKISHQILDLGCGSGRHANEMASRGYSMSCIDLSSVLLKVALETRPENNKSGYVQADMRYLPFGPVFDVVVSFFTTFGYFETDDENLKTLLSLQSVLKPGGIFFQDYLNRAQVISTLVPEDKRTIDNTEIIQERFYNQKKERIEKKITLKSDGKIREYFESVRLYSYEEMQTLIRKTDLVLEKIYGDFDGSNFTNVSPRLILIGKRKGSE